MRHPDIARAGFFDGRQQLGPIGVIRNDERQLDAALPGTAFDAHPAGRERRHGVGKAARPAVSQSRRRTHHEDALEVGAFFLSHRAQVAKVDAKILVKRAQMHESAVQVNWRVEALSAQQRNHALAFSQTVDAEQMCALWLLRYRADQMAGFCPSGLVAKHRQCEGCFRHEHVARHESERPARRIGTSFVVARDDDAAAAMFEHDLRRA